LPLNLCDVLGCGTFCALSHLKTYPVTFIESFKPGHVDGRMVNKYVPAVILLDKAITFPFTEPLHSSFSHAPDLLG
jgi:hypothetical protein